MIIRRRRSFTAQERAMAFWNKVEPSWAGCWLWLGGLASGYGSFWDGEKVVGAHVWAWEQAYGPIPEDQQLRHRCHVQRCVRFFDHLLLGTSSQNMQDMTEAGRCWYQQRPEEILRGDRHGKTKIPDALVPVLCTRHAQGESLRVLGEELGVTKQAIAYAIRCRGGGAQ